MTPAHDEGLLFVAVRDSGPGIPAVELPHIFERFYQGCTRRNMPLSAVGSGSPLQKK